MVRSATRFNKYVHLTRQAARAARSAGQRVSRLAMQYGARGMFGAAGAKIGQKAVDYAASNAYKKLSAKPKSRGYGAGRSGGFLKSKRKVTKKSFKKTAGYTFTGEYGGVGTSANVGTIGHTTMPIGPVMRVVWGAVIKQLLEKAGVQIDTTTIALDGRGLSTTDSFRLVYQTSADAVQTVSTTTYVAAQTLANLADYFGDAGRPWVATSTNADQIRFISIQLVVGVGAARFIRSSFIRLDECRLSLSSKSALKIQNRTVVGAGDDEADVNNQPIFGKSYSGKGTGADWRDAYPGCWQGSIVTGVMSGDDGTVGTMVDIPDPTTFKNVTKSGKMKLEPGELKTSVLNSRVSIDFNKFWSIIYPMGVGITLRIRKDIGDYRFFIYEKMLDTGAVYNMVLAFEHNIDMFCSIKQSYRPSTVKYYEESKNLTY